MVCLDQPVEDIISHVCQLDRGGCITELRGVPYLTLDFTDDYLRRQTVDQLRHILVAAFIQAKRHIH